MRRIHITRADMQKIAVRIWLFGIVSLLEMNLIEIIDHEHPNKKWEGLLSEDRVSNAEKIYQDRIRRNDEISLIECIGFEDKITIIAKNEYLRNYFGYTSCTKCREYLNDIRKLRDELAHSHDILKGRTWVEFCEIIEHIESLIYKCEEYQKDCMS